MKIDLNQYISDLGYNDVINNNVISCINSDDKKTILIRSTDNSIESLTFENEFFLMKNNVILSIGDDEIGTFHILVCKKEDSVSINHFERMCDYLFIKKNEPLSSEEMLKLFNSLETIFRTTSKRDEALEIGLYGELSLLMYLYENNNDIYKMWHKCFFSKLDMELDEKKKIEVKTTVKDIRKHSFNHDQIARSHLDVYIASFMLKRLDKGLSLFQLCTDVLSFLEDNEQVIALELLMKKLDLSEDYTGINCNKDETYEQFKLYDAKKIPHLDESIPDCISNIHYDIDLTNIEPVSIDVLKEI